ncbi:hypothetical protein [Deinococcus ruber]|uniref:Uncharacterized protein n=1 Tax=Deinococcus ruber TaxID=1848197 RepID=A0A918CBV1_9DEIO|nr:hypothetical protein [Deinococcus ruber]GGR17333.1 hypothetical protein GCM10008957_32470 [Deinococcus ruber]
MKSFLLTAQQLTILSPDALATRVRRLAQVSAAGRITHLESRAEHAQLRTLVMRASAALPVVPGAAVDDVLRLVQGGTAVAATLCYRTTRRARYLIREHDAQTLITLTPGPQGKEHRLSRDVLLTLFRGYHFTDVYVMPVPPVLRTPEQAEVQSVSSTFGTVARPTPQLASTPVSGPSPVKPPRFSARTAQLHLPGRSP